MPLMISSMVTNDVFTAYLKCPTKSYLEFKKRPGILSDFIDWCLRLENNYHKSCKARLASQFGVSETPSGQSCVEDLKRYKYPLLISPVVDSEGLRSNIDALEIVPRNMKQKRAFYAPIRMIPSETITKEDRCLLAFDALTISAAVGRVPVYGKIIHGKDHRVLRVKLAGLLDIARSIVEKIAKQQESPHSPQPVLNKHCPECIFRMRCRKLAEEQDDLSLLSKMSPKERTRLHNKGIFSVRQLSYTFKPRRKPKHLLSIPDKYNHALKALAIREQKIHVLGAPELKALGTQIFLDVEGIPDRHSYYLIGLRIRNEEACIQHSLWADDSSDEKLICASLIETLAQHQNSQLIYYGGYEKIFLKEMIKRYSGDFLAFATLDGLIERSINILHVIYAHIYFPTYSNGLKEIASYLGFRWSQSNPSALDSIAWRLKWEISKEPELKEKLTTYNVEDCTALELVFNCVVRLCGEHNHGENQTDYVRVESLKDQNSLKFRKNDFALADLEYVNNAAYWNYQRSRIYVKSNRGLKHRARVNSTGSSLRFSLNKIIEDRSPLPTQCPRCGSEAICRYGWLSNKVCDLKFGPTGIKRWIVKYRHPRLCCRSCNTTFSPAKRYSPENKYGPGFMAYLLYNLMDLQISQAAVGRTLNKFFGFDFTRRHIYYLKSRAAAYYEGAYKQVLRRLALGDLIHIDETKIRLEGRDAFVWVLTSLKDVGYVYSDTREAITPKSLLGDFRGVLVTDFYAAYDSINCRQQKCLIHLIRDLNDDLRKNPFNAEIQEIGQLFASLLRPIIDTIDRYGLKRHHLQKHLKSVNHFYKFLAKHNCQSEVAMKYRKRFEKYRSSLFTFLEYDGVPWNNNNAEHAIKALADLRNVIGGTSSPKGIQEYLILLSIHQTCKYRGIDFLKFIRSG